MKCIVSFLISLCCASFLFAQDKNVPAISGENVYAVIIGIANYENDNIDLNYANRDAEVFSDYLRSKTGGAVPSDNIRLLIDSSATTAAIYNSLNWLRERCELNKIQNEGQPILVYFYFSGHGDVETDTKANLGFLISVNTPPNNYINNAVRIEDLNIYAHTLSVDLGAQVIIITDACHSGKLAGSDNKGSFLVGKELSTAREKEIRIASCNPNELSNEDERWGGGRGVFSYYLINGLKGLADKNSDNAVTLSEIKNYVDSSIAADPILKEGKLKQTPVLEGNRQFKLASVNTEEFMATQRSLIVQASLQSDQQYFFGLMKNEERLESLYYERLNSIPVKEIPFEFIKQAKTILLENDLKRIEQLEKDFREDTAKMKLFNEGLVELLHTRGQRIINLYLEGDAAELERRRYYNSRNSGYDAYPLMYSIALKLIEPGNRLSHILKVNQLYFTGIAARLKLPIVSTAQQKTLLEQALSAQTKALALESNAAYIHNELGILYFYNKDNVSAEKYYKSATELAPAWAVPWANLSGLYAGMKRIDESLSTGQTAESLQPELQLSHVNLGTAHEFSGNYLFAEEYYHKAIDLNSRHYFPFERLGYVYLNTTQYALADSFFYEADLRKRGYNFRENELVPIPIDRVFAPAMPMICYLDTAVLAKDDIMAFFYWGMQEYENREYKNAQRIFKKVIAVDKRNPLVFHYLGKTFYDQKKWEDAELMFKLALDYYRDGVSFQKYCDSLVRGKVYAYEHACFETFFRTSIYGRIEDDYFLATLYESWSHPDEAESYYRKIIGADPSDVRGYVKLWKMMEKAGRYTESEKIIKSYAVHDKERSDRELNTFYKRVAEQFPGNSDWYYRLGLLLYEKAPLKPKALYLDSIIWFPKLNKEVFIDMDSYKQIGSELSWDIMVNGSPQVVYREHIIEDPVVVILPGVKENILLSDPIYTPRKDAITYLLKADSLLTETDVKGDINFKVGNVFVWSGSGKQAYPYYVKAVELIPGNANARLSLVDVSKAIYKNRAGLEQLTYLYDQQQINFPKRILYAEYSIHAAQFDKAKKLLDEAQAIYPYRLPEAFDLMGRLYLLSNQPGQAITWYNDYLGTRLNDPFTQYTIAKLYARSGNSAGAWKYLEASMKNGFNYMYVLNADSVWEEYRKNIKWTALVKKYPVRKYIYPKKQ